MAKTAAKTVRDLRLAAMAGDHSAARALLKLYGKGELAAEIERGKPWPPRVLRMVRALTAGTNTEFEVVELDGTITNILQDPLRVGTGLAARLRDVTGE
jgi:hypothetical protein